MNDFHNMGLVLGAMLKNILGAEIPLASNLPCEFLQEHANSFDCIPLLLLDTIQFIKVPPNIIPLEESQHDTTSLTRFLGKYGITLKEDVDDIAEGFRNEMKYNKSVNVSVPYLPLVWIPQKTASDIKTMKTPITKMYRPSFIHSIAVVIPVNVDRLLQHIFFQQMIAILLKRVDYKEDSKLEYSYYISNEVKLNLFIAIIG